MTRVNARRKLGFQLSEMILNEQRNPEEAEQLTSRQIYIREPQNCTENELTLDVHIGGSG